MLNHRLSDTFALGAVFLSLVSALTFSGAVASAEARKVTVVSPAQTPTVPLSDLPRLAQIHSRLDDKRVVFVGEFHARLQDHRIQLEIIRHMAAQARPLAIGVEWFQQPFQDALDRYLAGAIDTRTLLQASEYFERWGYDYRLYAPIMRFARANGIPIVALNVPAELTEAAARQDLDTLPADLRAWIPDQIDRTDSAYQRRLERVFHSHGEHERNDFDRFYTVQLLWDEGMAQRAARYLEANPHTRMVILAGCGHLAYGSGIPNRLRRRTGIEGAILLPGWEGELQTGLADYLLLPASRQLPEPGRLGLALVAEAGQVVVDSFTDDSPARAAGVKTEDVLLAINNQPVKRISDVRAALWDQSPGEVMQVQVRRPARPGDAASLTFAIPLR